LTVQPDQSPLADDHLPRDRQDIQPRLVAISHHDGAGEEKQGCSFAERVQEILASYPPLTAEQRARIVALLR